MTHDLKEDTKFFKQEPEPEQEQELLYFRAFEVGREQTERNAEQKG